MKRLPVAVKINSFAQKQIISTVERYCPFCTCGQLERIHGCCKDCVTFPCLPRIWRPHTHTHTHLSWRLMNGEGDKCAVCSKQTPASWLTWPEWDSPHPGRHTLPEEPVSLCETAQHVPTQWPAPQGCVSECNYTRWHGNHSLLRRTLRTGNYKKKVLKTLLNRSQHCTRQPPNKTLRLSVNKTAYTDPCRTNSGRNKTGVGAGSGTEVRLGAGW